MVGTISLFASDLPRMMVIGGSSSGGGEKFDDIKVFHLAGEMEDCGSVADFPAKTNKVRRPIYLTHFDIFSLLMPT